MKVLSLDYLVFIDIKIDGKFLAAQVIIEGYRNIWKYIGWCELIEFAQRGLKCQTLRECEPKSSECIFSEVNIANDYALLYKNHPYHVI